MRQTGRNSIGGRRTRWGRSGLAALATAALVAISGSAAAPPEAGAPRRTVEDPRLEDRLGKALERGAADSGYAPEANRAYLSEALDWLEGAQNPSGSWGSTYEFVDTATVVDALGRAEPAGGPFLDGAGWLVSRTAVDHDQLARKILALRHLAGYDLAPLAGLLLASQNPPEQDPLNPNYPEGGWGLQPGYETDSLTTALALAALSAAGYEGGLQEVDEPLAPGTTNVHVWEIPNEALKARIRITVQGSEVRLRMTEGAPPTPFDPYFSLPPGGPYLIVFPDSGLPFAPGTNYISIESPNPPALAATYTFTASYETPDFDTRRLVEALDYLRSAQNPDGGWGLQIGDPTGFYTTLHVLLAIVEYDGYDFEAELSDGLAYLGGQQLPDGSFGYAGVGVPYVSALSTLVLLRTDGCPLGAATQDAVQALIGLQDPDGSWVQEPYDTGLSLLALWEYDPDGDGILADGDCSGTAGDNPCAPGSTVGCDDNCAAYFNADQDAVAFEQSILAASRESFVWSDPEDVRIVRGDLAAVSLYGVDDDRTASGATAFAIDADLPSAGSGVYYLVRLDGACGDPSWQSSVGTEPGRDAALP